MVPWRQCHGNGAMATGECRGDVGGFWWRQRVPQGWDAAPQARHPGSTSGSKPGPPLGFWSSRSILGAKKGRKVIPGPPSSSGTTSPDEELGEGAGTRGMMPWEPPAAAPRPEAEPTRACALPGLSLGSPWILQLFPALLMLPFPTITREARDLLSPPA